LNKSDFSVLGVDCVQTGFTFHAISWHICIHDGGGNKYV
jgi:hypothetical protein